MNIKKKQKIPKNKRYSYEPLLNLIKPVEVLVQSPKKAACEASMGYASEELLSIFFGPFWNVSQTVQVRVFWGQLPKKSCEISGRSHVKWQMEDSVTGVILCYAMTSVRETLKLFVGLSVVFDSLVQGPKP